MAKAKAKKTATNGSGKDMTPRLRKPKQADLPGTEDRAIKALEDAAEAYAEIRDDRMELNKREFETKAALLSLMKKHDKTVYHRNGITITIVAEEETVKVRVKKGDDEDDDNLGGGEFGKERRDAVESED